MPFPSPFDERSRVVEVVQPPCGLGYVRPPGRKLFFIHVLALECEERRECATGMLFIFRQRRFPIPGLGECLDRYVRDLKAPPGCIFRGIMALLLSFRSLAAVAIDDCCNVSAVAKGGQFVVCRAVSPPTWRTCARFCCLLTTSDGSYPHRMHMAICWSVVVQTDSIPYLG